MYHGIGNLQKKGWVKKYNNDTQLNWWAPKSKAGRNTWLRILFQLKRIFFSISQYYQLLLEASPKLNRIQEHENGPQETNKPAFQTGFCTSVGMFFLPINIPIKVYFSCKKSTFFAMEVRPGSGSALTGIRLAT